jgi:hypothetical protein
MSQVIGTCGNCGGPVSYPNNWMGTGRPSARCENCKSEAENNWGPTLPMKSKPNNPFPHYKARP